jgi:hypothetical protein
MEYPAGFCCFCSKRLNGSTSEPWSNARSPASNNHPFEVDFLLGQEVVRLMMEVRARVDRMTERFKRPVSPVSLHRALSDQT